MGFSKVRAQRTTYIGPASDSSSGRELHSFEQGVSELEDKVAQAFEQFRDSIYRYLMAVMDNPSEAEEITQEVFLQLCRCLDSGQKIANVRAWAFRVAHNLALNQKASSKHLVALELPSWGKLCELCRDPAPNPEQAVLGQEEARRFQTAFGQLTSQQRACLVLRAEGFRYAELAKILGISVANVAQSLRRGVKRLMKSTHE